MATRKGLVSTLPISFLILVSMLSLVCSSPMRLFPSNDHIVVRRSRPLEATMDETEPQPHSEPEDFYRDIHSVDEPAMHGRISHHKPSVREEEDTDSAKELGMTRVVFDGELFGGDDDYYDQQEFFEHLGHKKTHKKEKDAFPKKAQAPKHKLEESKEEEEEKEEELEEKEEGISSHSTTSSFEHEDEQDLVTEPSSPSYHSNDKRYHVTNDDNNNNPIVLPVTTEGKTPPKQKTEEVLKVYGIPKELLPIMPGGGSRFEDVEREKLEKKKMSQTKGGDDDSAESSSSSHEAEGLYSSASLSSISLCFYWLMSFHFHHFDRILML